MRYATVGRRLKKLAKLIREGSAGTEPLRRAFRRNAMYPDGWVLQCCTLGAVQRMQKSYATDDSLYIVSKVLDMPSHEVVVMPSWVTGIRNIELSQWIVDGNDQLSHMLPDDVDFRLVIADTIDKIVDEKRFVVAHYVDVVHGLIWEEE